ncbi:exported protein of unknown function [Hyphomicrobium sp. MC1]|nr:exported protein of unknown function [Hyphomicrobium sp. MC1]
MHASLPHIAAIAVLYIGMAFADRSRNLTIYFPDMRGCPWQSSVKTAVKNEKRAHDSAPASGQDTD